MRLEDIALQEEKEVSSLLGMQPCLLVPKR